MNMPEDPTSIPFREDGRPIPPVEGAWSQMEKKLDITLPTAGIQNTLRPWYGRLGVWAAAGAAAAAAAVVITVMIGNVKEHAKKVAPEITARSATPAPGKDQASRETQASAGDQSLSKDQPSSNNQPSAEDQPSSKDRASSQNQSSAAPTPPGTSTHSSNNRPGNSQPNVTHSNVTHSSNSQPPTNQPAPNHNRDHQIAASSRILSPGSVVPGNIIQGNTATSNAAPGNTVSSNTTTSNTIPSNTAKSNTVPVSITKLPHNLTPTPRAPLGPNLTTPVKAADSLLSLAAAKHSKGTVTLAGSRSSSPYRQIPRLSAGFTFKQYLPLPNQQFNDYNTDGSRAVYSDYVPAVFVRAAINHQSYLQASFGFHSPQYTRHMTLDNENLGNSTVPGYVAYLEFNQDALKKLFYNELDLTYHYQIADRWRLGAGIQYAFLSGGAIESQTILQPANPALKDTVYATQLYSMKHHTSWYEFAHTKTEWRGILEIEYCWTQWVVGLRYQQAIQSLYFIPSLSPGQSITNGALSIRASYALWERKRR